MRKRQNRQLEPCRRNPTTYIWKPLWAPPEVDPFHSGHFHETLLVAQPGQQICPQYPLPNPAIVLLNPPTHHAASRLCTPLASSVLSELTALSSPGGWSRYRCTMCEPGDIHHPLSMRVYWHLRTRCCSLESGELCSSHSAHEASLTSTCRTSNTSTSQLRNSTLLRVFCFYATQYNRFGS